MAGSATRPGRLIAALTALVLALHLALLAWLASAWATPSVLRPLTTPMFTRLITPASPDPVPKVTPALIKSGGSALQNIAKSTPDSATPTVADLPLPIASAAPAASAASSTTATSAIAPAAAASEPLLTLGTTASAAPSTPANPLDSWPADTRLSYRLTGNYRGELNGKAQVQWQRQGSTYQARIALDIGFLVSLSMTSQGEVTPQGLVPRAFEETLRSRRRAVTFGSHAITLANGQQRERPDGVQDTTSQFVALSHRFSTGQQALAVGETLSFWMARPGGLDLWTYTVQAEETLYLPLLGPVQAFHLLPAPLANPRGNIVAEMWFAPSLQYLPVRIRISLGEENFVDLLVEKIEQQ